MAGCLVLLGLWIPLSAKGLEAANSPGLGENWKRFLSERFENLLAGWTATFDVLLPNNEISIC